MGEMDDADDRDIRRRLLAKRLISHRARTQTVQMFTGLSRHRLETLRQRWGVSPEDRHRGPSPTAYTEFFRTARNLQAATAAALLCNLLAAIPRRPLRDGSGPSLEAGERLCHAYEVLRTCYPLIELEFEHLLLLVNGLADGTCLRLGRCSHCGAAILLDILSARSQVCVPDCTSS